jgi:hypothetical protein
VSQGPAPAPGSQGDERDREAVSVRWLPGGIAGVGGRYPGPVWFDNLLGGRSAETMLSRQAAYGITNLRVGQRQNAVTQKQISRRQPIKPKQRDDETQRRAVDEQREQHEAGGEDRDKALRLRRYAAVFGDRESEDQSQRPAQPAPGHRQLVRWADRLRQPEALERRHHREQHQRARRERRRHQDDEQQQVAQTDMAEQPGHEDRREHEHQ